MNIKIRKDLEHEIKVVAGKLHSLNENEDIKNLRNLADILSRLINIYRKMEIKVRISKYGSNNLLIQLSILDDDAYKIYEDVDARIELELTSLNEKSKVALSQNNFELYREYILTYEKLLDIYKEVNQEYIYTRNSK
jgi:hypothetical protein